MKNEGAQLTLCCARSAPLAETRPVSHLAEKGSSLLTQTPSELVLTRGASKKRFQSIESR